MNTFDEWLRTTTLDGGTQESHMRQAWDAALKTTELDGATTVPADEATITSVGEFAARWNADSTQGRARFLRLMQANSRDSYQCFTEGHVQRLQDITPSIQAVARERARQPELGYTTEHDDQKGLGHLVYQAVLHITGENNGKTPSDNLVKAAALLVSAIDYLDRQA